MLPQGAGPDEHAHTQAANFIYEHNRLPVYQQDKDALYYSIFGATRSFRPPLVYISSAFTHKLLDKTGVDFTFPYRKANAIIGALSALLMFLTLYAYTQKTALAVSVTLIFMLMPQTGFVYSYLNEDGAAIMSCILILLSVCLLLKNGVTAVTLVLFGFACGILSLTKLTAWGFCLPICIFAVFFILRSDARWFRTFCIVFTSFAVTAGWRIAFNMLHHGLENPFNWSLEAGFQNLHARIDLDTVVNYKVLGMSYLDLLFNGDNFLVKTFYSLVGHLDWLRLPLGPLQYAAYGAVLLAGALGCVLVIFKPVLRRESNRSQYWFEISVILGCLLLFFLYMHFNINNDIQTQGRYLLPAFPGFLLISVTAWFALYAERSAGRSTPRFTGMGYAVLVVAFVYVHAQAMYKYVIPFYYRGAYLETADALFTPVSLQNQEEIQTHDLSLQSQKRGVLEYLVTGPDPGLYFENVDMNVTPDYLLLKISFWNSRTDYYSVYWDAGQGMSEGTAVQGYASLGDNIVYQLLPVSAIENLRFDLGSPETQFRLTGLAYGKFKFKPVFSVLNRLFNYSIYDASH